MKDNKSVAPRVFKNTADHEGYKEIFSPQSDATRYLTYARLVFGDGVRSHALHGDDREWSLFAIKGPVEVRVKSSTFELSTHDILYIPRTTDARITGAVGADIALGGAPAHADFEPQLVRFADIRDQPEFCIEVGSESSHTRRTIYNMLGGNVKCSRLLAGFTVGTNGAWTSWPPHEHEASKEEFYLFFDMPPEAFSVQFCYPSAEQMDFAHVVRNNDCVSIPHGYHPTCAAPGYSTVFHWVMAAFDPQKHRDLKYGINIQPDYKNVKFL